MFHLKIDIYKKKLIWKWSLFLIGAVIVLLSLLYTNSIVKKISVDEQNKVTLWVDAIERKAALVNYTNDFFGKIEKEERKRVELWAEALQRIIDADFTEDLSFYTKIITQNTNIPVIVTDIHNKIITHTNVQFISDTIKYLEGELLEQFSENPTLLIKDIHGKKVENIIYYKESILFSELRMVLNDLIESFFEEIVTNNPGVPVIVTDTSEQLVFAFGNIDSLTMEKPEMLSKTLQTMRSSKEPIKIQLFEQEKKLIFYQDSFLLRQLRYYPYIQFLVIGVFLLIAYILFSMSRKSEQNQVWVGMAKETAHQLGTPLSSMLAWIELLKDKWGEDKLILELSKDVQRLEHITERFSKIGSQPMLQMKNIYNEIVDIITYIKARSPQKVFISIEGNKEVHAPINSDLFGWVIENVCKNAIDAMEGKGNIIINIEYVHNETQVVIDITDTGKGIPKSKFKRVFKPGYTTKTRGWGLGLSLASRIISDYHNGKIFIRQSALYKGTTLRIILNNK